MTHFTKTPDEIDLIEFFESEPAQPETESDVWAYSYTDKTGITVRFSFNILETSVQTMLLSEKRILSIVCQEGAEEILIENDILYGRFCAGNKGSLKLTLRPFIAVEWSNLIV